MARSLPRCMYLNKGAYYLVRQNKWTPLGKELRTALIKYADLMATRAGSLDDIVDRALDHMKPDLAASTYKNYCTCARRVKTAFANFAPSQVTPVSIGKFLDHHRETPNMANLLRSFLKSVFTLAVRWGDVTTNPVRDIKPFKVTGRDRYITADEFAAIHAHATPTLQILMDLAYITGQRMGDVRHIRYADISPAGVYVKQQKTKARILIEMTPDLDAAIARARALHQSVKGMTLLHRPNGQSLAYGTIHHQWLNACKAAGVDDANFHDIRGATATDAKAQGLNSRGLLGHTTEQSHNRYQRSKEVPVVQPVPARKS